MTERRGAALLDDRGVSDALGFVFVFAIVTSTVAFAYVGGLGGLQDARDFERVNNAERAFDVLVDNMEDISERGAPSRATEIKLSDAQLRMGEEARVNVTAVHATTPSKTFTREFTFEPIEYDAGTGTQIIYANGALVRQQADGSVIRRGPNLILTEDRVVVPVIITRTNGPVAIDGSTTVLVRAERAVKRVSAARPDGPYSTVYLNVTSPRAAAWSEHLDAKPDTTCTYTAGTSTTSCTISNVDQVYVTIVEIDIAFE